MAENVFAMTLRMRNQATTTARNLKTEVKGVGNEAQKMGTKFGKSIKATRTSMGGLLAQVISLKQLIILAFAYKAVMRFGRFLGSLTKGYEAQEQSVYRLGETLAAFGNYTVAGLKDLEVYAGGLQKVQGEADDLIITNMALLASYGAERKQIKELTPLLIDFAKAKGIDMKTAFDLAGKASVGYFGTLSRYGIILDANLTTEEKYAAFLEMLSHHKGTAATLTDTYAGKIKKLGLAYGDMKEPLGEVLEAGMEQSGMLDTLADMIEKVALWLNKWKPVLIDLATRGFAILNRRLKELQAFFKSDFFIRGMMMMGGSLKIMAANGALTFHLIKTGLQEMAAPIPPLLARFKQLFTLLKHGWWSDEYKESAKAATAEVKKYWEGIDKRSSATMKQMKKSAKGVYEGAKMLALGLDVDGPKKFREQMEARRQMLMKEQSTERNVVFDSIRNREKQAEAMEKVLKISKSMAAQFAMASKLEQEQTKFVLQKLKSMSVADVGKLSQMEKKLISKQSVLKESFSKLFGEYAAKQLGLETDFLSKGKAIDSAADTLVATHKSIIGVSVDKLREMDNAVVARLNGTTRILEQHVNIMGNAGGARQANANTSMIDERLGRLLDEKAKQFSGLNRNIGRTVEANLKIELTPEASELIRVINGSALAMRNRSFERAVG